MRAIAVVALVLLVCGTLSPQTSGQVSATGYLTDTLCGKAGATALHIEHAKRSVASGKAKYAIYDERTKQLYILRCTAPTGSGNAAEDAACIEPYLGQRVTITGTLTPAAERRAGEKAVQTLPGDPSSVTVARHTLRAGRPLDTSTPVAGTLTISSIAAAPSRVQ